MFNLLKMENILIVMCKNIFIYFLLYQDFVNETFSHGISIDIYMYKFLTLRKP